VQHLPAIGHRERIPPSPKDASPRVVRRNQEQAPGGAEERAPAAALQGLSYLLWCPAAGSRDLSHERVSA